MATITTTIKEPKTFQQIQDQQNELDKEKALENLNNNITKLIKTLNEKSEKKITQEDKQLKQNQLELSKLQLRRAQLGLARDEKSYSDYSYTHSQKYGTGYSLGIDQKTRSNASALAIAALSGGVLNPVVIRNLNLDKVIMAPIKMMAKAITGLFSNRRISGKSSSTIESYEKNRLHGKLDQILNAIKSKTRSDKKEEKKSKGFLSKILGSLLGLAGTVGKLLWKGLKGALGAYLAIKLGEKIGPYLRGILSSVVGEDAANVLVNTMQAYIPSMAAGYMIAGWRGALAGLAFHLLGEAIGVIKTKVKGPTLIDVGADKLNELLDPLGIKLTTEQFKGVVGGFALAGPKGALLGLALGTEIVQKAIQRIKNHDYGGILEDVDDAISNLKKGTPFENVSNNAIKGAIAGGIIGGKFFGFKGLILGAILGAAGGLVWDRYKNANDPSKFGLNTQFDPSKLDWNIAGLDKTWTEFRKEAKEDLKKKGVKLTTNNIDQRAAELANAQLKKEGKSNEAKSFSEVMVDHVTDKIKEHPLLTAGIVAGGGLATLGISTAEKILTTGVKALGKAVKGSVSTLANGSQLAALVKGIVLLWIAKGLWDANNEVNSSYENELFKSENKDKEASEILKDIRNKAFEQGKISEGIMATVQGLAANVTEFALDTFEGTGKEDKYRQALINWENDYKNHNPNEMDLLTRSEKAQQAANASIKLLQRRRKEFVSIQDRKGLWTGDDYLLNENENNISMLNTIGLSTEEIKKFNEIQRKKDITDKEAEFLITMAGKIGSIDKKDNMWQITNQKQQEKIEETKQKSLDKQVEKQQCLIDQGKEQNNILQKIYETTQPSELNQDMMTPTPWGSSYVNAGLNGYEY